MSITVYLNAGAGETEIKSALAKLSATGGTLVLPKDADITVKTSLYVAVSSKDITIDLNGSTLHQTGNQTVVAVSGAENPLLSVKLGLTTGNNTTITYEKLPTELKVGSYVKVTADNALPGDHIDPGDAGKSTLIGQAAKVIAIHGTTVVLDGQILEQGTYQTNVRATLYSEGQFTLKNGTIDGSSVDYVTATADLVHVRNLKDTVVENLKLSDSNTGVNFVNNVNALAKDIVATNLWAGIHTSTSLDTVVNGMFAEHVGHGILVHGTGTASNAASASSYGADIGLVGQNLVVYDASMAAYDFHSESRNGTYTESFAFNSRMFGDFRGIGNTFENSGGVGNQYGIQFYEYGSGDGRDSTVSNLIMRETANYTFIISNLPQSNVVLNSFFESYGKGYNMRKDIVDLTNSTVIAGIANDNDVIIGTSKADNLLGGKGTDIIMGGAKNDFIWGGLGADTMTGGSGRDRFAYHSLAEGGDHITDFKVGASGDVIDVSVLSARLGWDIGDFIASGYIRAQQFGFDTIIQANNGSGWTTLATLDGVTAAKFDMHNIQTLLSDSVLVGEEDADGAIASNGVKSPAVNEIKGTDGNEWFAAKDGAQTYIGSLGDDAYVFNHTSDIVVSEVKYGGIDTIYTTISVDLRQNANVENVRLNAEGKAINAIGNELANLITGNASANVISGGAGNDSIYGKGGSDTFVFSDIGSVNRDSIWDFDADDMIFLSKSVFVGLDPNHDGLLDASQFILATKWGAGSVGAGPQVIYNSVTGIISFDSDGAGGSEAQDIAFIGANKSFFDYADVLIG